MEQQYSTKLPTTNPRALHSDVRTSKSPEVRPFFQPTRRHIPPISQPTSHHSPYLKILILPIQSEVNFLIKLCNSKVLRPTRRRVINFLGKKWTIVSLHFCGVFITVKVSILKIFSNMKSRNYVINSEEHFDDQLWNLNCLNIYSLYTYGFNIFRLTSNNFYSYIISLLLCIGRFKLWKYLLRITSYEHGGCFIMHI